MIDLPMNSNAPVPSSAQSRSYKAKSRASLRDKAFRLVGTSGELSAAEKCVATLLLMRFNLKTGRCDPSMNSIAQDLELGVRTVQRAISTLTDPRKADRLFDRETHGGNYQCNAYRLRWASIAAAYDALERRVFRTRELAEVTGQNWQGEPANFRTLPAPELAPKLPRSTYRNQPLSSASAGDAGSYEALLATGKRETRVASEPPTREQARVDAAERRLQRDVNRHPQRLALWQGRSQDWDEAVIAEAQRKGSGVVTLERLCRQRKSAELQPVD